MVTPATPAGPPRLSAAEVAELYARGHRTADAVPGAHHRGALGDLIAVASAQHVRVTGASERPPNDGSPDARAISCPSD
ncbi:hypothetical protein ACFYWY_22145 [Streptomyces sp. NPDC002870]|uniref:hypothetical protein n=1 Tax=Streptomyces sp. NPDC002870 TaxID=3364666 RepID=UPI0036B0F36E